MGEEAGRVLRFVLNGLFATAVHYAVLAGLVEGAGMASAAVANALAAVCGIAVSYFGNRSFVLRSRAPHRRAGPRFLAGYAAVVALHGGAMSRSETQGDFRASAFIDTDGSPGAFSATRPASH